MASAALETLRAALREVTDLSRAARPSSARLSSASLRIARVAGRAQVVLLCSHFERYLHAVNEEAVAFLNAHGVSASSLPLKLKLLHSKYPIDKIAETAWTNRGEKLVDFVAKDAWLWSAGRAGRLSHERLLLWLTTPTPDNLLRYYRYWAITDIFAAITRNRSSRSRLWLGIQELVDKRNAIAHGDFATQATPTDVRRYADSVRTFCARADRRVARTLAGLTGRIQSW